MMWLASRDQIEAIDRAIAEELQKLYEAEHAHLDRQQPSAPDTATVEEREAG